MIARIRFAPFLAVGLLLASSTVGTQGCARQPEGGRCSLKNGDVDCGGDLSCTPSSNLRYGADKVDRCCPDSGFSDTRCTPGFSGSDDSGEGGQGGSDGSGEGGQGGEGQGQGKICNYNSDCALPLVCKTTCNAAEVCKNSCEYECNESRDCLNGYACTANTCLVAAAP